MKTKSWVSVGMLSIIVILSIYSQRCFSVPILGCVRKENGEEGCSSIISSVPMPKVNLQDEADESGNTIFIPFNDENNSEMNEPKDDEKSVEQEKVATTIKNATSEIEKGGDDPLESILAYGEPQEVKGLGRTLHVVKSTLAYMKTVERTHSRGALEQCKNRNALCAFWASEGECESNSNFMARSCGPSCQTCHLFEDSKARCLLLDADKTPALKPGDLDRLMEHIVDNRNLTAKVYSRPGPWIGPGHIQPPWVVSIDNFLTPDECALVRDKATTIGFEPSTIHNGSKLRAKTRQSETSWCTYKNQCRDEKPMQGIMQRISDLLLIPAQNFENFQIVKYERGQYYRHHRDVVDAHFNKPYGPRILSFMVYLNDVEDAGETTFPDLDVVSEPKLGKALFWPNVLNENLLQKDERMVVNELPVGEGQKLTLHSFIHLYNYIDVEINGCQ